MNKALLTLAGMLGIGAWFSNKNVEPITTNQTTTYGFSNSEQIIDSLIIDEKTPKKGFISKSNAIEIIERLNYDKFNSFFNTVDILAIIQIESSFRIRAYREEKHLNDASRGLMQLLLSTARDRGFTSKFPDDLYAPAINISTGMQHLKWGFDYLTNYNGRVPSEIEWVGAYNFGIGNARKGKLNHTYYNKFKKAKEELLRGL